MSSETWDSFAPEQQFQRDYDVNNIYGELKDINHAKFVRGPFGSVRVSSAEQILVNNIVSELSVYSSMASYIRDSLAHRNHYWLEQGVLSETTNLQIRECLTHNQVGGRIGRDQEYASKFDALKQAIHDAQSPTIREELRSDARKMGLDTLDSWWAGKFLELGQ